MTYSDKLDLDRFLFAVREQIYVIVKFSNFPSYYKGSDMDVFCYNKDEFAKTILNVGNWYLDQGFEIEVTNKGKSQTYVDFYCDGELEFRFDLYGSLPEYKKIRLKEHYISSVIENAVPLYKEFNGAKYTIYVPSAVDDLVLRYVEYIEWYELRPDKIKHLDYIVKSVSVEPGRIGFIDKLHMYTELPEPDYDKEIGRPDSPQIIRFIRRARSLVKRLLRPIVSKIPFALTLYRKIRRFLNRSA